jgi:hypothetical protein
VVDAAVAVDMEAEADLEASAEIADTAAVMVPATEADMVDTAAVDMEDPMEDLTEAPTEALMEALMQVEPPVTDRLSRAATALPAPAVLPLAPLEVLVPMDTLPLLTTPAKRVDAENKKQN